MRNIRKVLLLALLGILGCENGNVENENATNNTNDTIKTDTALVLKHVISTHAHPGFILLCNREGELYEEGIYEYDYIPKINGHKVSRYANTGDTVIVARDKEKPYIIRNLTMENKIKAFSNHR